MQDSKQEKVVMVDRSTVEALCKVAGSITLARDEARKLVEENKISYQEYEKIRNQIGDCYHVMAVLCDCAPIRLIANDVDSIMSNMVRNRSLISHKDTWQQLEN